MNAELYILRNVDKPVNSEEIINSVAETLRENGIRVAYKTEMDAKREKIIYGLADSLNPDENIGLIVILNGFENEADDTTIFKTLSSLTSTGGTADKKRLEDAICGFTGKFVPATAIGSDGNKNGYIFVVNGLNIVLLPKSTKDNAAALVRGAVRELKALGLGDNKVKNDIVEVLIDQVEADQLQKKLDNLDKNPTNSNEVDFYTNEASENRKFDDLNFHKSTDEDDQFSLIMIPGSDDINIEDSINRPKPDNEILIEEKPVEEKPVKEKPVKEKPKKEKIEKPKPELKAEPAKAVEEEPKQKKK